MFVLMLTLLVSCAPNQTSSLPTPTVPVTVTPDPSSPKIIPFFTTESDPDQLAVLQSLIAEYQNLNPGIEVDIVIASPASRGTRLLTSLASGADLGIFEIEPALMSQWADAGYLLPVDDVVTTIGADDFVEGSLFRQNETTYAVPYAVSVYGLWVRKDLFEQAGLPLPTTYEEVLRAAKILTNNQTYGIALPAGQNIATVNYFSTFLWQNGGDYFTCDGGVAFRPRRNNNQPIRIHTNPCRLDSILLRLVCLHQSPRHEHGVYQQRTIQTLRYRPALGMGSFRHTWHRGYHASRCGEWQ